MWSNLILEANLVNNYNFGFLNNNSDIIISLLHWQYWWWFWFFFLISLYYLILLKYIFSDSLKFNPKIVTSYRSHGKWGDVLVGFLPISWCVNILSNSTTLLKLIEWQSEASFMTLRVRGKQWYWVYKIDNYNFYNLFISNKYNYKIGKGLKNLNKEYLNIFSNKGIRKNKLSQRSAYHFYTNNIKFFNKKKHFLSLESHSKKKHDWVVYAKYLNSKLVNKLYKLNLQKHKVWNYDFVGNFMSNIIKKNSLKEILNFRLRNEIRLFSLNNYKNISRVDDRLILKKLLDSSKVNKVSGIKHMHAYRSAKKNFFLKLKVNKFNLSSSLEIILKSKTLKKFNHQKYLLLIQRQAAGWSKEDDLFTTNFFFYKKFKNYNSYNSNRLLKVNQILMLPTNVFINVITNSFDVVHSWFIPGLGFKMDCVPGRSTHHSLFIDLPGIYYGQCAEICGRLHHHMPIRICAVSMDHFIMWYNHSFKTKKKLIRNNY